MIDKFLFRACGNPFEAFHDGEDEDRRQDTAHHEDEPQLPEFDPYPHEATYKEKLITDGSSEQPSTLHESLEPWRRYFRHERYTDRAQE